MGVAWAVSVANARMVRMQRTGTLGRRVAMDLVFTPGRRVNGGVASQAGTAPTSVVSS